MAYWIFKLSEQELYPDIPGKKYVFDNTHSVRVQASDVFLYLDKRARYSFTATGMVGKVQQRSPSAVETKRTSKIHTVFEAHLRDVIWFEKPLSISAQSRVGRRNRAKLGIIDANRLGWSGSIPSLSEATYQAIMDLAETERLIPLEPPDLNFSIPDKWAKTKVRRAIARFSTTVLDRHLDRCVVCGTQLKEVIEVAHLSPYATDKDNRANPGNGICLCAYCHRALDRRVIAIQPDGQLLIASSIVDPVALTHFERIRADSRKQWLNGVDPKFLQLTVELFKETSLEAKPFTTDSRNEVGSLRGDDPTNALIL